MNLFQYDFYRYAGTKWKGDIKDIFLFIRTPVLQFLFYSRKSDEKSRGFCPFKLLKIWLGLKYGLELSTKNVGKGLFIVHPYGVTINPSAILGENINIHKGVTIGQENRGSRAGSPVIGSHVWIGMNAVLVGKITVGNDVLIAPNSYVNRDIPDHSIVIGNPCIIKSAEYATKDYINQVNNGNG